MRDTKNASRNATFVSLGAWSLVWAVSCRRTVMIGWFWGVTTVVFRILVYLILLPTSMAYPEGTLYCFCLSSTSSFSWWQWLEILLIWSSPAVAYMKMSFVALPLEVVCQPLQREGLLPLGVVSWEVDELAILCDIFPTGCPTAQWLWHSFPCNSGCLHRLQPVLMAFDLAI